MRRKCFLLPAAQLLSAIVLLGCGQSVARGEQARGTLTRTASASAPELLAEESCRPTFLKIADQPLEVWAGYWKFGFDAYLVGCATDLHRVTTGDRAVVADYLKVLVQEKGLPFFMQHQDQAFRNRLVSELNAKLGHRALSDILIVSRYSIEHEPAPDRP
jgi:hypothetical protein